MANVDSKNPSPSRDFDALESRYRSSKDWAKLARLYQSSVQELEDRQMAIQRLLQAGILFRDKLGQEARAEECFEECITILSNAITETEDKSEKSDLLCDLAKIYLDVVNDRDKAIEAYVQAFENDPDKTHLMTVLGDIYAKKEGWQDVVDRFSKEATGMKDPNLRARYLGEVADIYSFVLNDPSQALEKYQEILKLDPHNQQAIEALESLFIKEKNWSELADFYSRLKKETTDPDETASICTKLGLLYKDKLKKPLEAIRVYEEIIELQPNNFRIAAKIEELRGDQELWGKNLGKIETQLIKTETPSERVPMLLQKALIAETYLGKREVAAEALSEALRIDPSHPDALDRAVSVWTKEEAWNEIAQAYERASESAKDKEVRKSSLAELARISLEKLQDPAQAISSFEALLELEPANEDARQQLISLYESQRLWGPLETLLETNIKNASEDAKVGLNLRLAKLRETHLANIETATSAYENVLQLDAHHSDALSSLERLYPVQQRWKDLVEIYKRRTEAITSNPEKGELYLQQARTLESKIGDLRSAAAAYESALPLIEDASSVSARIEQIYFSEKMWPELEKLYKRSLKSAPTTDQQIKFLSRLAELYEQKLSNIDEAKACLEGILRIKPEDSRALHKLERIAESRKSWPDLIQIFERQAIGAKEGSEKVAILLKMGDLHLQRMDDPEGAREVFKKILELEPTNRIALDFLTSFYRKHNNYDELLNILETRAASLTEPQPLSALNFEMGQLLEGPLHREAEAVAKYENALKLDPTLAKARNSLAGLYKSRNKWSELVQTYVGELEHTKDRLKGANLAATIGRLYQTELKAPAKAIEYFGRSLQLAGTNLDVLRHLTRAYEDIRQLKEALPYYERLVDLSNNDSEKARACLRIGEIQAEVHQDHEASSQWYERALSYEPDSQIAMERLTSLYESLQNWQGLLHIYERILPTLEGSEAALMHYRIGEIYEQRLNVTDQALVSYQIASESDPSFVPPLVAMRRLLKAEENWGEYLRLTQAQSDLTESPEEKVELLYEIGRLWRENFLQNDKAISSYERVLEIQAGHVPSLIELSELHTERGDVESTINITTDALKHISDNEQRVILLDRLATTQFEQKKDYAAATTAYREILGLSPQNRRAIEQLTKITEATEDWKNHLSALQMQLEIEGTREERVQVLFRMAELWRGPMKSPGNAVETTQALLRLDPTNTKALTLLGETISNESNWKKFTDQLLEELKGRKEKKPYIEASVAVSDIYERRFKRPDRAIHLIQSAIGEEGDQLELLEKLIELYDQSGEAVAMADTAMRRARLYKDSGERAKALLRVANMWAESLDNPRQAIEALGEAAKLAPDSTEIKDRLIHLQLRTGDWKAANELLEVALKGQPLTSARAQDLCFQRAALLADRLDQKEEAVTLLEELLTKAPDHRAAIEKAGHIYAEKEDWKSVARCEERLAELTHGAESIEIRKRLGTLYEKRLNSPKQAIAQFEQVLRSQPRDRDTLATLEQLHERRKDYDSLVKVLQQKIALAAESEEVAKLYCKLGEVWRDHLKDEGRAIHFFERSLEADEKQIDVLEQLINSYRAQERHVELAETLRKRAELAPPKEAVGFYEELADLWQTSLSNRIQALEFLNKILEIDDSHRSSLNKMASIHRQNENYRSLAWNLRRLADTTENKKEKLKHLLDLAEIQQTQLGSRHEAIDTYQQIITLDPHHAKALEQLRNLFGDDERWKDLANVLQTLAKNLEPKDSGPLLYELAKIQLDRLHLPEKAMATLEKLRKIDPNDEKVLHEVQGLYEQHGIFPKLAESLEEELTEKLSQERRLSILKNLGAIYDDRISEPEKAIACFEKILKEAPEDIEALSRLESLYRKAGRDDNAAEILEKRAALLPKGEERATTLESLADHYWTRKKDVEATLRCYRALAEDPEHRRRALERIALVQREKGDFKELSETLGKLIEEIPSPQDRVVPLLRLGAVFQEKLSDTKSAENQYLEALKLVPHQPEAVEKLKSLYRETKAWKKASKFLEGELQATKDIPRRVPLLKELAELWRGPLKDPSQAVSLYEELVRIAPHEIEAISILAQLYFEKEAWKKAAPLYERLVKVTAFRKKPEHAAKLFYEMGIVARELGHPDDAILHFHQALTYDRSSANCVRALADLFYDLGQWDNAIKMLRQVIELGRDEDKSYIDRNYYRLIQTLKRLNQAEEALKVYEEAAPQLQNHLGALKLAAELYKENENWPKSSQVYERILKVAKTPTDKQDALCESAKIVFHQEKDVERTKNLLNQLLKDDPNHASGLELYLQIVMDEKEWPDAIHTLERLVQVETDSERLGQYYFTLGQILDQETGDLKKARQYYMRSIEVGIGNQASMEALKSFCKTEADWKQLAKMYEKSANTMQKKNQSTEAANFQLALGQLYEDQLNDAENAVSTYREAVKLNPDLLEAQLRLGKLFEKQGHKEAEKVFTDLVDRGPEDAMVLREVSRFFEKRGRKEHAFALRSLLVAKKEANEEEKAFVTKRKSKVKGVLRKSFDRRQAFPLLPTSLNSPVAQLFSEASQVLIPVVTSGARSSALLSATEVVPEHTLKTITEIGKKLDLGLKKNSVYYSTTVPDIHIDLSQPPSIAVGPGLYKLNEPLQEFLLIYQLSRLRLGAYLMEHIPEETANDLIDALYALSGNREPRRDGGAATIDSLKSSLSRKDLRTLTSILETQTGRGANHVNPQKLLEEMKVGALRLACLLTDDIEAVFRGALHLGETEKDQTMKFLTSSAYLNWRENLT